MVGVGSDRKMRPGGRSSATADHLRPDGSGRGRPGGRGRSGRWPRRRVRGLGGRWCRVWRCRAVPTGDAVLPKCAYLLAEQPDRTHVGIDRLGAGHVPTMLGLMWEVRTTSWVTFRGRPLSGSCAEESVLSSLRKPGSPLSVRIHVDPPVIPAHAGISGRARDDERPRPHHSGASRPVSLWTLLYCSSRCRGSCTRISTMPRLRASLSSRETGGHRDVHRPRDLVDGLALQVVEPCGLGHQFRIAWTHGSPLAGQSRPAASIESCSRRIATSGRVSSTSTSA